MTVLSELLSEAGLPANLFEMMLRDERRDRVPMRPSLRLLGITLRMVRLVVQTGRLTDGQARPLREGRSRLEPFRTRDWTAVPLSGLLIELDTLTALRNSLFWFFFCCVFNSAARARVLRTWVARKAPGVEFGDLLRGVAGIKSLEPSLDLIRLAEQANCLDEETRAALLAADDGTLRALLGASEQGRVVLEGVDAFLARHGYLSSNGSDFSFPSWAENPALIWRSIVRGVTSASVGQQKAGIIREAASARVCESGGPLDRWVFRRLMAGATTSVDWRERVSVLISEYTYEMRRLFLAAGRRLVEQGCLAEPESLFYLTRRELGELAAGRWPASVAAECIERRRTDMAADAAMEPPEVVVGLPGQPAARPTPCGPVESVAYLSGIGGSPGRARGFARIIHDPADAPATLGHSDILVVPFSDVGWTPLFAGIGGIVAETGGQLSHAAIVAREYNLPAVVSVRDATRRIYDGQALTVDGGQGRVYLE